jgi:hypothetical protein
VLNLWMGISPNSVLQAPETWRDVIYLEAGYLQLLWIGGIPLLAAFAWLSVAVLRRTRELVDDQGPLGATASALRIVWWFLLVLTVIDPHLTMRGIGDLLFTLMAITTGRLATEGQLGGQAVPGVDAVPGGDGFPGDDGDGGPGNGGPDGGGQLGEGRHRV